MATHLDATSLTTLVLCGGLGTRLRPVTGALPKALAPVAGRPFLDYLLRYIRHQGITDVVLCTGHEAAQVADHCNDGAQWGIRIRYSPEPEPLGTGGAIKHAQPLIASSPFLVLNADSLVEADLGRLVGLHLERRAWITIVLARVSDRRRFGSVMLAEDGSITGFLEKGERGAGLINAGIYLMDRAVLELMPGARNVSVEHDVFPRFTRRGLYGMVAPGPFVDIGEPETYSIAQTFVPHWLRVCRV